MSLFAFVLLTGCSAKQKASTRSAQNPPTANIGVISCDVTFNDDVAPILERSCRECHSSGGTASHLSLETYAKVVAISKKLLSRTEDRSMPPAGRTPLTDEERGVLNEWVRNGMPERRDVCSLSSVDACLQRKPVIARHARQLTNRELENSIAELFSVQLLRDLPQAHSLLPVDRTNRHQFDTELARSSSSQSIEAYQSIGEAVASFLTANATRLGALYTCLTQSSPSLPSCVVPFIQKIGKRAYRRPLTTTEVNDLSELYVANLIYSHNDALEALISAIIQSPHFSTILEINGPPLGGEPKLHQLTSYEVATRLAFTLWGTPPDETLLTAADRNELLVLENVKAQGLRLMQDPKAKGHALHFLKQVLGSYASAGMQQSTAFFDGLDPTGLPIAAEAELDGFVDYLFEVNAPQSDFFLSRKARIPISAPGVSALKAVYGMASSGTVDLPPERAGIMSRIAFLLYSTNDVHPILRGLAVRRIFLCQSFPPPPPGLPIPPIPQDPNKDTNSRALEHTSGTNCIGCHTYINPMGYLLASFDSIGRFRTRERLFDESGAFKRDVAFSVRFSPHIENLEEPELNGHLDLAKLFSSHRLVNKCFVRHRIRFSEGGTADSCEAKEMESRFREGGIQDMLLGQIGPEFLLRRIGQ